MAEQLHDKKNEFSKVVQDARHERSQTITIRGECADVVLSAGDYDALRAGRPTLVDDLLDGPSWDDALAVAIGVRARTRGRNVKDFQVTGVSLINPWETES